MEAWIFQRGRMDDNRRRIELWEDTEKPQCNTHELKEGEKRTAGEKEEEVVDIFNIN